MCLELVRARYDEAAYPDQVHGHCGEPGGHPGARPHPAHVPPVLTHTGVRRVKRHRQEVTGLRYNPKDVCLHSFQFFVPFCRRIADSFIGFRDDFEAIG